MTSLYNCTSVWPSADHFSREALRSQYTSSSSVVKRGMTEQIKYCFVTVTAKHICKLKFEEQSADRFTTWRMRWAETVARMVQKRASYTVLGRNLKEKRPIGRYLVRNIETNTKEIGWLGVGTK